MLNCEIYILAMKRSWVHGTTFALLCVSVHVTVWRAHTDGLLYHSLLYLPDDKCLSISLELDWQPVGPGYPPASLPYPQHCSWLLAWVATWLLGIRTHVLVLVQQAPLPTAPSLLFEDGGLL